LRTVAPSFTSGCTLPTSLAPIMAFDRGRLTGGGCWGFRGVAGHRQG
jgi:hypothetical protein